MPVIRKRKKIVKKLSSTAIVKLDHTVSIWTFTFHKQIRLCKGDLEGQFQTSLQALLMNFLI